MKEKWLRCTYVQGRNGDTDTENKYVDAGGIEKSVNPVFIIHQPVPFLRVPFFASDSLDLGIED